MPDPITPESVYGLSNPPIPIEETPEITVPPVNQSSWGPQTPPAPPAPASKGIFWSRLGTFIFFIALFIAGVYLSGYIRKYFPGGIVGITPGQQELVNGPTITPTPVDPYAGWKTYQVINGTTKMAIDDVSFRLPADVLSPICDTTSCMSQGTYLPGGTRFTVAPRGVGQLLADSRGSAISDVGGIVFVTKDTTVSGHKATEFTGSFTGKTVAGYGFSQMRGYMIEVTSALSLEINHFVPSGIMADFSADDALFDKIVNTLVLPGTPSATPIITPPSIATPSGS